MAKDIPTGVPDTWIPGDTIQWYTTIDTSQYDTTNYTLVYTFTDGTTSITSSGTQYNSQAFLNTVASGVTATLSANTTYGYSATLVDASSGLRYTIDNGLILTEVNYGLSPTTDPRSFYEKALDAIEAVIEGRASETDLSYSIGSGSTARSLSKMSFDELISARGFFLRKLKALRRKERTGSSIKHYYFRG